MAIVIMTEDGWFILEPKNITRLQDDSERYTGPLPSLDCIAYVTKLKREHDEWIARRAAMQGE